MASTPMPGASVMATSSSSRTMQCGAKSKSIFNIGSKHNLRMCSSSVSPLCRSSSAVARSSPSEIAIGSSNISVVVENEQDSIGEQNAVEAATEFMIQVSNLVQLVDSRDIIELKMKQQDCEIIIRKKEAMDPPPPPQVIMMQSHELSLAPAPQISPSSSSSSSPAVAMPAPSTPPSVPATPAKSSHPPLKSPMAGTFYRSPGPGQSPFVKVGDKVNKGQVLCIIEAMKLMNEIEADQSGTVLEILAEDAKPVSIEQPLFVIEP
ncbi:biotin carboxyl carrier protein of acetyl-CoA carboxylase 1, chloroplastic-like [Wolffia australiana]